jgi:hypothetical protein
MLSAKDLAIIDKKKNDAKKEFYKALLEQFSRKIKAAHLLGHKEVILQVPQFFLGYPSYNLVQTVNYMFRQLLRLGYSVDLVGPLDIKVRWKKVLLDDSTPENIIENEMPSLVNLSKMAREIRTRK